AAFQVGCEEVDDLEAGLEDLLRAGLVFERWRRAMNWPALGRRDRALFVDGVAKEIKYAPERFAAHWHGNGAAEVVYGHSSDQSVCGGHGDGADHVVPEVLRDLHSHLDSANRIFDSERVQDGWKLAGIERNIDDGSLHRHYFSCCHL